MGGKSEVPMHPLSAEEHAAKLLELARLIKSAARQAGYSFSKCSSFNKRKLKEIFNTLQEAIALPDVATMYQALYDIEKGQLRYLQKAKEAKENLSFYADFLASLGTCPDLAASFQRILDNEAKAEFEKLYHKAIISDIERELNEPSSKPALNSLDEYLKLLNTIILALYRCDLPSKNDTAICNILLNEWSILQQAKISIQGIKKNDFAGNSLQQKQAKRGRRKQNRETHINNSLKRIVESTPELLEDQDLHQTIVADFFPNGLTPELATRLRQVNAEIAAPPSPEMTTTADEPSAHTRDTDPLNQRKFTIYSQNLNLIISSIHKETQNIGIDQGKKRDAIYLRNILLRERSKLFAENKDLSFEKRIQGSKTRITNEAASRGLLNTNIWQVILAVLFHGMQPIAAFKKRQAVKEKKRIAIEGLKQKGLFSADNHKRRIQELERLTLNYASIPTPNTAA